MSSGFQKKYSTADNIFVLHTLIQLVNNSKKKLFSAFIDLKRAFDTVWRAGLWSKLLNNSINGKCLKLIQNIYSNIYSSVFVNNKKSDIFTCNIGVRQGENLSPILFSIYLNDLEDYFSENTDGILLKNHIDDDTLVSFFKLFCLLYADDILILESDPTITQRLMNMIQQKSLEYGLEFRERKLEIIYINRNNRVLVIDGSRIRYKNSLTHFGAILSKNKSISVELGDELAAQVKLSQN